MTALFMKIIRAISINRVLLWGAAAMLALVLYTVYENRGRISAAALTPRMSNPVGLTFSVGDETRMAIESKVKGDPSVVGVAVMSADLRLNEARSVFFYGDDAALNAIDKSARIAGNNSIPMFTSDERHNSATISLINGHFGCMKFSEMLLSKIYPEMNSSVRVVCKSSIPSYYGYFSGYVAVFLSSELGPGQEDQLKVVIEKLATDIYFRDVLTTQHQENSKAGQK